jgi:hypothetical protein
MPLAEVKLVGSFVRLSFRARVTVASEIGFRLEHSKILR